jgi:ATP-dependent DNA helicase RecQ
VASEAFGFDSLRPGQREAIEAVLAGRDTLAVMSTGSGKSAIYQIAGLLTEGATVVVSPLIALQREQVSDLNAARAGGAAQLNSNVPEDQRDSALAELAEGVLEFLFLAPEQLAKGEVLGELAIARPSLLVVDEAHCISEWGHDFRPEYLRLGAAAEALGRPTILALTATAAPPVREEIVERLGLGEQALVLVRGFDRPNLHLAVERHHEEAPQRRALLEAVAAAPPGGIVYVATRRDAEEVALALAQAGLAAAAYHGGMRGPERDAVQERFMAGRLHAVVATTAFGMGVDKPDVRWVFHGAIPESLDSYFQEIGRGGRDSRPAEARLFYRSEDVGLRRFFAGTGQVEADEIDAVLAVVVDSAHPVEPERIKQRTDLSQTKIATAVSRLEDVGAVMVLPGGEVTEAEQRPPREQAVERAARVEERRREFGRSRVEMMRGYAETTGCRRAFVLSYFGEPFEPPCGNCDNCDAGRGEAADEGPFPIGGRVVHDEWGAGVVQRYEEGAVVVLFDDVGYRKLSLEVVIERGLLEAG